MVIANAYQTASRSSGFSEPGQFGCAARSGLFDQDLLSRGNRAVGDFSKRVMQCSDNDDGYGGIAHRLLPRGQWPAARNCRGKPLGASLYNIGGHHKSRATECLGAFLANEPATDYCNTQIVAHRSP